MRKRGFPEKGELVVCRVTAIHPNSVDVEMIEYGKKGMVHVSEVAKRWVRDIREFIREGQYLVCKTMKVDGNNIHLSIKRVHRNEAENKLSEFKRERKAEKLLELAGKGLKKSLEESYEEIGYTLQEEFGSLSKAFEVSLKNPGLLKKKKIPAKWIKAITEVAEKSYAEKTYRLVGELNISFHQPDGIERIKDILLKAREKNKGVEIKYISAPKYSIFVSGNNYKKLEAKIREAGEEIAKEVRKQGGEANFVLK